MSIDVFIAFFAMASVASSLVTEAVKKAFSNLSSNVIALIDAVLIGGVGSFMYFVLKGTVITPVSVIFSLLMALCVWLGSMVGYDKVMQTLKQIRG